MTQYRRDGEWMIAVDHLESFANQCVSVRIARRTQDGKTVIHKPDGVMSAIDDGTLIPYADAWHIPTGAVKALCAALLDQDPASERLTAKLEVLLDRESARVDKLIDRAIK